MVQLLKDLRSLVPGDERERIEELLHGLTEGVADAANTSKSPDKQDISGLSGLSVDEGRGEADVTAEVGSNEDMDMIDEDLLRSQKSRATGYIGKNSEIQWLRRLNHEVDFPGQPGETREGPYGPPGKSVEARHERLAATKERHAKRTPLINSSSMSYYLDDENVEMDFMAAPFELPPFDIAEKLLQCYMDTAHNSFPFLAKKTFVGQFYHYYASRGRGISYKLPQKWQAMLNMVFAIGAVYSHLTEAEWRSDDRDHFVYHSRAWSLSLKDPWWFSHPDVPQVQITGLLSLYYLSIGHVNRAWVVIGMALRFGYSLGLHVRNEDKTASPVKRELLCRIWWATYALERMISSFTGRPSVGVEDDCSVPLPLPLSTEEIDDAIILSRFGDRPRQVSSQLINHSSETSSASSSQRGATDYHYAQSLNDSANSGSYLKSLVQIAMLTQRTLHGVYSASVVTKSWESVQKTISDMNEELEAWAATLPAGLRFLHPGTDRTFRSERITLRLYFHSTQLLLTRPCLCRIDRRIDNQTTRSDNFNKKTAEACVNAAKSITDLLPDLDHSDASEIYRFGPWWAMVHYIMQALVVLLLELAFQSTTSPRPHQHIVTSLKKLVRLLASMRANNAMARRAYTIISVVMEKMRTTAPDEISEILSGAEGLISPIPDPPDLASNYQQNLHPGMQNLGEQYQTHGAQGAHYLHNPGIPFQDPLANPSRFNPNFMPLEGQMDPFPAFLDVWSSSPTPNPPYPNLFVTNFDESNPLPFDPDDVNMSDYPNQQWN
ncbi:fungal-specific transcription factor domain-containing protein [Lophiotrema nucula]|uniref:Fungal-specific transcription factor domain-containing protein n=1 Tax=Lophiotrema nucula TaxID=690887 RepID=A0A6A5YS34_9PLEO|nr:fungal-specific transcription factor domain-containing protein [Lophiotrema nucula]